MTPKENLFYASANISGIQFKVISSAKGIKRIYMNDRRLLEKNFQCIKLFPDDPYMFGLFDELNEYFNLERKKFSVPLVLEGTDFQKKVWREICKIPYGKTATYKSIALKVGTMESIRAVGKAAGSNHIPIVIPCHRVIGTGGKLVGYAGGIKLKEKLLELEGTLSLELFTEDPDRK